MTATPAKRTTSSPAGRTAFFPVGSLRREMEDLFQNFFGGMSIPGDDSSLLPGIDVSETDDSIQIHTDLPGLKAEDISIDVRDNIVTISGSSSEEKDLQTDNGRRYHRIERRRGSFSRSVALPGDVDANSADAVLKDGVLHLTLRKTAPARAQKITVRS